MADDDDDQSAEQFSNYVRIENLPSKITAKEITTFFGPFGNVIKLYLKRRISKDSSVPLLYPRVTLVFDNSDSVEQIMARRPFSMGDRQLFVRRVLPISRKYPSEAFITVKKILIRTNDEILFDDNSIIEYLSAAGGNIDYFERLDNKTVLIQFDDYDPVDVCCLSRPHCIKNQPVEIEKCSDENLVREYIESQQKYKKIFGLMILIFNLHLFRSNSVSSKVSPAVIMDTTSPTPTLSADDQMTQLRSTYHDITNRLEREHEQFVAALSAEWEQTAKERIRFQRLTLDHKQEHEQLTTENRKWQKLYSESLREKPSIQSEGEVKLSEAYQKNVIAKDKYDQLIQNIRQ